MNDDRINSLQIKEDFMAKEKSLFEAQSTINELQKCLEQTREEVLIVLILKTICVYKIVSFQFMLIS